MKFNKNRITKMNNAIDPAFSTSKDFGFKPVPGKGGKTTNYDDTLSDFAIKEKIFGKNGGAVNA